MKTYLFEVELIIFQFYINLERRGLFKTSQILKGWLIALLLLLLLLVFKMYITDPSLFLTMWYNFAILHTFDKELAIFRTYSQINRK